jgi:hypothetical protein
MRAVGDLEMYCTAQISPLQEEGGNSAIGPFFCGASIEGEEKGK